MKYSNEIRENANKGFSLVELIVVIAIMAVMAAVLAPALLGYVERSRAQKDDSAMGELTNAVKLALADQDVFDEVLAYTSADNSRASCYVDKASPSDTNKVVTKDNTDESKKQFMYNDSERKADETVYGFAGKMRGVTITFKNEATAKNKATFDLAQGVVNGKTTGTGGAYTKIAASAADAKPGVFGTMTSGDSEQGKLYNRVRATVGDKIELSSQTYRNSEYTVFIRMGSTGGNQASAQDAIQVYGQWNGTNLS